jgi:hypothetical protein
MTVARVCASASPAHVSSAAASRMLVRRGMG